MKALFMAAVALAGVQASDVSEVCIDLQIPAAENQTVHHAVYNFQSNGCIYDGGDDVYDDGNCIVVGGENLTQWNWTEQFDFNNVSMQMFNASWYMGFVIEPSANDHNFSIIGGLGADGDGNFTVRSGSMDLDSVTWSWLTKSVYATDDPGIYHMWVSTDPGMVNSHNFSTGTGYDNDQVTISAGHPLLEVTYWSNSTCLGDNPESCAFSEDTQESLVEQTLDCIAMYTSSSSDDDDDGDENFTNATGTVSAYAALMAIMLAWLCM